MPDWSGVGGVNEGYVLELYERFRQDPSSVDARTRAAFEQSPPAFAEGALDTRLQTGATSAASAADLGNVVGAVNLAESIRRYGHLGAQLDPLGTPPWGDPSFVFNAPGTTE